MGFVGGWRAHNEEERVGKREEERKEGCAVEEKDEVDGWEGVVRGLEG